MLPLSGEIDFIMLGSDGIFDHLDNKEIIRVIQRETINQTKLMPKEIKPASFEHVTLCCGASVNGVLKAAMESESTDNLSVVLLTFRNF